ncbi:hypothetical protein ABT096_25525 [Streptomyces sp. NPDC002561]|uniref:hypothetical protein n=1 Tax=unclassified Streptomyces TaxID=2593676 RepID=UPI0011E61E50|nr:hypothetical protein [Streptomyces sp. sk2.1]TXS79673.1 hypothetical protein EAO76_02705 [Streptomyces sp. sk2.1]
MAGTNDTVADDDALYVLTAALLTPAQFPSLLGDDYPAACAAFALEPYAEGYGLVLGQDGGGARWTVVVEDVSLVAVAIAAWDCGMEYDLSPDDRSVVCALPGWPLPVAVSAPGVAAPHDPLPDPEAEGTDPTPLAPPDTDSWGPAQRRMGADEIAHQWAAWREQLDGDPVFGAPAGAEAGSVSRSGTGAEAGSDARAVAEAGSEPRADAGSGAGTDVRAGATAEEPAGEPPSGAHPGVRRALAEARGYLDTPPPPGRVRSSFAPGEARMLRADGLGWSLVARTDDIAFILLDEEPGEVLPVGRGTELPGLLKALDALAVRPA